jgi:hypothetical protein
MKKTLLVLGFMSVIALTGCSSAPKSPTENPSGFLPDYALLKPVTPAPEGMQVYSYVAPNVNRGDYHAVIVAPVTLYQTATKNGITTQDIADAQVSLQNGIRQIVSQKIPLTTIPGPGVAQLNVAITGAEVEQEGMKPRNLLPISAAIKLASVATGLNGKTPIMVIEMKFTDSVNGRLLKEILTTISGDQFRTASNASEFNALVQTWVQKAMQYSAQN